VRRWQRKLPVDYAPKSESDVAGAREVQALAGQGRPNKHSTQKHRRFMLRRHLLPRFGDSELSEITRQQGVPGKVTAQLIGHANVDTAINVYTQVLDGWRQAFGTLACQPKLALIDRTGSPARLERATSWFVGQCRLYILLLLRWFSPTVIGGLPWCSGGN
jgi:hypothetical protein